MRKVALVVDNSGSLTREEEQLLNINKIIPISFIVNGEEYYENKNMSYSDFYDFLNDKNTTVSTSQPSIEFVKEEWREVLKSYDEIVYIVLSSGLSEACNSAINASNDDEFLNRVFVVNNQRVAFMNKMAMFQARHLINQGKSGKEIKEYLSKITGVALGSDAFFPFDDNIERAHLSGVSYIAEPGGSIRDDVVISTSNKYNMVLCFTGMRLFHH